MDITVYPGKLRGTVAAIASKSFVHRGLICAALADGPTNFLFRGAGRDIDATIRCLQALGAHVHQSEDGCRIEPIQNLPNKVFLNCGESGSTLRFLLPVAGALGVDATFRMEGRLPERPLSPLWEEMERMGCQLSRPSRNSIQCTGKLLPGCYRINGNVSSQFLTGLFLAFRRIPGENRICITGPLESKPYVDLTRAVMSRFGAEVNGYSLNGGLPYTTPGTLAAEADWSNAAFFLAAKSLGNDVNVTGLDPNSRQGDRRILPLLSDLTENIRISAADIPDLIPILSVVASVNKGAVFTDIQRLRLKESDRVRSIVSMINALGGKAFADETTLTVCPATLTGGTVSGNNDHRIVMSAAIAATVCSQPVHITDAYAVRKSYPVFWDDYASLGGKYEQHLR